MFRGALLVYILCATLALASIWYIYATYYEEIYDFLGVRTQYAIFIDEVFFSVTVADDPHERQQGLSNTARLDDQTGLLFIFDESDRFGMWMKDMRYAIDILWINDQFEIVHVEENITPDTYPKVFGPPVPARFVLEVPAFTVSSFAIKRGQQLSIPAELVPADLQNF
jgi:hypothetical protein